MLPSSGMSKQQQPRRRRYEGAEIEHWLGEQDREGLSYRQLSVRSGVPVPTLAGWRRRSRMRDEGTSQFVELHASDAGDLTRPARLPAACPVLHVVLANGRRIDVEGGFDDAQLVARLATLLES